MTNTKQNIEPSVQMIDVPEEKRVKCRPLRGKAAEFDPIERAEQELARLAVQFEDWMEDETKAMEIAYSSHLADPADTGKAEAFFRCMHDLRGQSETLGYPLAGEVANNLCRLLETVTDRALIPSDIVERHVQTIRAIVREQAKDGTNKVGRALSDRLVEIVDELLAAVEQ